MLIPNYCGPWSSTEGAVNWLCGQCFATDKHAEHIMKSKDFYAAGIYKWDECNNANEDYTKRKKQLLQVSIQVSLFLLVFVTC